MPSRFGARARKVIGVPTAAALSLALLFSVAANPVFAAGGTNPTPFNTGTVNCRLDFISLYSSITAGRPVMQTFDTTFNGYFAASSKLQYSTDQGQTWHSWQGTKRSHGRTRIFGSGASAFHNASWGTWDINSQAKVYAVRVKTTFRWLDPQRDLIAKRVRLADYYRTETFTSQNPLGQLSVSDTACVLVLS